MVGTACHLPSLCMEDEPCRPTAERERTCSELVTRVIFEWGRRFAFHGFLSLQVNFSGGGLLTKKVRELSTTVSVNRTLLPMVGIHCLPVEQWKLQLVQISAPWWGNRASINACTDCSPINALGCASFARKEGDGRSFNYACDLIMQVKREAALRTVARTNKRWRGSQSHYFGAGLKDQSLEKIFAF